MSKINEIFDGLNNSIFRKDNVEELSKYRMSICNTCKDRDGNRCSLCGCFLNVKTRSTKSKCPVNKW